MQASDFPEIKFRNEFADFAKDPFVRAINYVQGKDEAFRNQYLLTSATNLVKYRDFCRISHALRDEGIIRFVPVKGMYIFNTLFFDFPGLRSMADVDLLFRPDEYKKLPEFFEKHPEFAPAKGEHSFFEHGCEAKCVISGKTLVELHSRITAVPISGIIDELFENIEEITNADGETMMVPKAEYAAAAMLMHDYTAALFVNFSVRRIIEFYIVLLNLDMKQFRLLCSRFSLDRMLDLQLFLINTMLEDSVFSTDQFRVREEFGCIKKVKGGFCVENPLLLCKALFYGKSRSLGIRNFTVALIKQSAVGRKICDKLHK